MQDLSSQERQSNTITHLLLGLLLATSIALVVIYLAPPGVDRPAHLFQLSLFAKHGLVLWDNYWYLGGYSFIGYSLLFYPLASVFSIYPLVLFSMLVGLWATFWILRRKLAGSWLIPWLVISITWPLELLSGAYPYIFGQAIVAVAIALLVRTTGSESSGEGPSRLNSLVPVLFLLLAIAIWATSPLDLYFLDLFVIAVWIDRVIGWFSADRRGVDHQRMRQFLANRLLVDKYLIALAAVSILEVLVTFAFPSGAYYPFWWTDLVEALIFVGILWVWLAKVDERKVKVFLSVFTASCLLVFFVRSELGANATRISDISLLILAALYFRYREELSFKLSVVVMIYAAFWGSQTVISAPFDRSARPQSSSNYWKPAISFLKNHLKAGQRVEVVDSASHFGDYFLPASSIPIVRGWFRQDDFPTNELLYQGGLSAQSYLSWLRESAVSYVLLPGGPYDFSSSEEAKVVTMLGRSSNCLHQVFTQKNLSIYRVCDQRYIVPGARVVSFGVNTIAVLFSHPGNYRLSLHFTPYFRPSVGCIYMRSGGLVGWEVPKAGVQTVRFQLTVSRLVGEIFEQNQRVCAG